MVALLSRIDDIEPGLYLLQSLSGDWAVLRLVINDDRMERVYVTKTEVTLPAKLLLLFQSVGLRISVKESLEHWNSHALTPKPPLPATGEGENWLPPLPPNAVREFGERGVREIESHPLGTQPVVVEQLAHVVTSGVGQDRHDGLPRFSERAP